MTARGPDDRGGGVRAVPFTLFGMVFQLAISFISGLIVARVIGPAAFGVFSLARTWCETANLFTKAGFDTGVVRYLGARPEPGDGARTRVLQRMLWVVAGLSSLPLLVLLLGGARWLEATVYPYAGFALVITAMAVALPFMAVLQVLGGMFRGLLRLVPRVACELILQPGARLLIIVVLFALGYELGAVVAGTVASFMIAAAVLLFLARKSILKTTPGAGSTRAAWPELRAVAKYSLVIALTTIVAGLLNRADLLFLGYFVGEADVGRYAVVQTIVVLIALFNGALNQFVAPLIARSHAAGDTDALRRVIQRHTRWVVLSTLPVFVVIAAFGDRMMVIFGDDFVVDGSVVALLALAQFLVALFSSAGFLLSMTGRHNAELYIMVAGLAFNVVLSLVFIPRWGMTGAAAATCCAMAGANLLRAVLAQSAFRIAPVGRDALRPLLIGGALAAAMLALLPLVSVTHPLLEACLFGGLFCIAYAVLVVRFGLVDEDRALLSRFRKRFAPVWRLRCESR